MSADSKMINVFLIDDHKMFRQGLKRFIDYESDMKVVGEASNGVEGMDRLRELDASVVLLDITLPGKNGLEILKEVKGVFPKTKVIILSMHPEERFGVRALKSGADGYLTKESAADELVEAVRKVVRGRKHIPQRLAEVLAEGTKREDGLPPHEALSARELSVMLLIGSGKTPTEIARQLNLSPPTISTYRKRILTKMNMTTTVEIMRYVMENQLAE